MTNSNNYNYPVYFESLIKKFTPEQKKLLENADFLEAAYRKKLLEYTINDVRCSINSGIWDKETELPILDKMSEEDIINIAIQYLDNHDCNIDDNSQLENLLMGYIRKFKVMNYGE